MLISRRRVRARLLLIPARAASNCWALGGVHVGKVGGRPTSVTMTVSTPWQLTGCAAWGVVAVRAGASPASVTGCAW